MLRPHIMHPPRPLTCIWYRITFTMHDGFTGMGIDGIRHVEFQDIYVYKLQDVPLPLDLGIDGRLSTGENEVHPVPFALLCHT